MDARPRTIESLLEELPLAWDQAPRLAALGRELQTRNRLEAARRVLERALALAPEDVDAWANLAWANFRSFREKEGEAALARGIEATGSDVLKGILASFTSDEALSARLEEEIAGTTDPAARAGLWNRRFGKGERKEALEGLRDLRRAHPENEDVAETLLWTLVWAKNAATADVDVQAEALPLARAAEAAHPDSMAPRWMTLMLLAADEAWDALLAETERVLARFPDDETVMQYRAKALRARNDLEHAAQWLHRAIGAKPSFVGARIDLGRLYEQEGRLDLAEETFREIPLANPDYAPGPMSLALFFARHDRLDEAEATFLATWPRIPVWFQSGIRNHPDAKVLLEREAVRALVSA